MSTTLIDYDLVVKELSKGLVSLDSGVACCFSLSPHLGLAEWRTIRYGAGRQKGATAQAVKTAGQAKGPVLLLTSSTDLRDSVIARLTKEYPDKKDILITTGYLSGIKLHEEVQFETVIIDEAGRFFRKFSFDKVYRALADVTTADVVIHLIN